MREFLSAISENGEAAIGVGIFILIAITLLTNITITTNSDKEDTTP